MECQPQRIHGEPLKLDARANVSPQLATEAVSKPLSCADCFEGGLTSQVLARPIRSQQRLDPIAGFPALKTLEPFDFTAVHGVQRGRNSLGGHGSNGPRIGYRALRQASAQPIGRVA